MSVAIANDKIYSSFRDGKTLCHGHTFGGNPILSAVALKALELYEQENIIEYIKPLTKIMEEKIESIGKLFKNSFYNSKGMIAMVEISQEDGDAIRANKITQNALEYGLYIRPLGSVIYIWPPLIINQEELITMFDILKRAIEDS